MKSAVRVGTLWSGVLVVGLAGLLAGCAGKGPTPEEQKARETAKQEAIEDILSKPLAADAYAQEERCLSSRSYDHVDILDDQHVVFRGRGDDLWLNKLRQRCVGLRPDDILQFKMRDTRICDLDTFESIDTFALSIRGPTCSLGTFTPITPEQVDAIKAAVKESRGG